MSLRQPSSALAKASAMAMGTEDDTVAVLLVQQHEGQDKPPTNGSLAGTTKVSQRSCSTPWD